MDEGKEFDDRQLRIAKPIERLAASEGSIETARITHTWRRTKGRRKIIEVGWEHPIRTEHH